MLSRCSSATGPHGTSSLAIAVPGIGCTAAAEHLLSWPIDKLYKCILATSRATIYSPDAIYTFKVSRCVSATGPHGTSGLDIAVVDTGCFRASGGLVKLHMEELYKENVCNKFATIYSPSATSSRPCRLLYKPPALPMQCVLISPTRTSFW